MCVMCYSAKEVEQMMCLEMQTKIGSLLMGWQWDGSKFLHSIKRAESVSDSGRLLKIEFTHVHIFR